MSISMLDTAVIKPVLQDASLCEVAPVEIPRRKRGAHRVGPTKWEKLAYASGRMLTFAFGLVFIFLSIPLGAINLQLHRAITDPTMNPGFAPNDSVRFALFWVMVTGLMIVGALFIIAAILRDSERN